MAAGEPLDRRQRYLAKMKAQGFQRVSFLVPPDMVELMHLVAKLSRTLPSDQFSAFLAELQTEIDQARGGTERPQRSEDAPRPRAPRQARG